MKLTKNIIADIYDEVVNHEHSKLATLTKAEFVNAVYSKVDDRVNRLYTFLLSKYPAECIAGIDRNAPDYKQQARNASKRLAASELIWECIDSGVMDVINYVIDNNIPLRLDDWGSDQFGAVVEYNGKEYIVTAHFTHEELEAHESDYGALNWDDPSIYTVEAK